MQIRPPSDLVLVGHITGAYGVHGWVRIHPYSADADALLQVKTWWLGKPEVRTAAPEIVHDVEKLEAKRHGDDVVAKLMGVVGRDAAEALKGHVVQVQRSHFPALDDGEFYWLDLIGLSVENCQGEQLGVVVDLIDNGAHPILRVVQQQSKSVDSNANSGTVGDGGEISGKTSNASSAAENPQEREYLIPFVEHFVPKVDQLNKKITVDWGLDY